MNRNKVYAKSKENQIIIKALNMYGRIPETWELLEEIERLNNIINELEKVLYKRKLDNYDIYTANVLCDLQSDFNEILQELERSDKE